jgi:predicted MFS family arabinose efflux permease
MQPKQLVPAGVSMIAVTFGFARYGYGLFLPHIRTDFQLTTEFLGLIASGSYAGFLLATGAVSIVATRLGPRIPIIMGGMLATIGMLVIGMADHPLMLAAGVVLAGTSPGWAWPPMSDVVVRFVPHAQQSRALTTIGSGTSVGVIIAGPIALWSGTAWRTAWLVFSILALITTVWNAHLIPHRQLGSLNTSRPRLGWRWFICPESVPLFLVTFILGLAGSVYWTFAVDLVVHSGIFSTSVAGIFWMLVGSAGVVGMLAGDLMTRYGLRRVLPGAIAVFALSLGMLPLWTSSWLAIGSSAILFGAMFIVVTVLLGAWSVNIFYERPSAGLGAQALVAAAGQLVGPSVMGFIAGYLGLPLVFLLAATLAVMTTFIRPKTDVRMLIPETG